MDELGLAPATLADLLALIEAGTISGKIGKQLLPDLFQVRARALPASCSYVHALADGAVG